MSLQSITRRPVTLRRLPAVQAVCWLACQIAWLAPAAAQPTLNIFPSQMVDNIKETGATAMALENDLQSVIAALDQQQQLYIESRCEGADGDQGCAQISREMATTYGRMLDIMAEQLPKMERSVNLTRDALRRRLADELGNKRTGADLQRLLRAEGRSAAAPLRTRPVREGMRLSDRFTQYYNLVSQSPGSQSLALLGAQMYLDLEDTSELIALTQQQIQRSRLVTNLSESFGTITPAMEETVTGVKRILFGEIDGSDEDQIVPADLSAAAAETENRFCSELDPDCRR